MSLTVEATPVHRDVDPGVERRAELGAFLRSRRERIGPEQVGLPHTGRRRTPGLRREEVAQLANVGVTWFTWLEQGRDIHVSEQVLDALARALMLDGVERRHLFRLAGSVPPDEPDRCFAVSPATRSLMHDIPWPAVLQSERFDLLAHNAAYALMSPAIEGVPAEERNSLWLMFTHPAWRDAVVDWEFSASRLVAQFRGALAAHPGDPTWTRLLARLQQASPAFGAMWDRHEVQVPDRYTKQILHPTAGLLTFETVYLWLCERRSTRMCTYVPADDETRDRLAALRAAALCTT